MLGEAAILVLEKYNAIEHSSRLRAIPALGLISVIMLPVAIFQMTSSINIRRVAVGSLGLFLFCLLIIGVVIISVSK